MLVAKDHEVSLAGNCTFQNAVIRFVLGHGVDRTRRHDDLGDLATSLRCCTISSSCHSNLRRTLAISRMIAGEVSKTNRPPTACRQIRNGKPSR